jgi:hypothetical protein
VPGLDAGTNRKIHGGGHKIRWACAPWPGPVRCPHCEQDVVPTQRLVLDTVTRKEGKETRTYRKDPIAFGSQPIVAGKVVQTKGKTTKIAGRETPKIVPITVFYNSNDQALWEYRGEVPTATNPRPWFESDKKRSDEEPEPRPYVPMPDGTRFWLDEGTENEGEYICSGTQAHRSTIFVAGTKRLEQNKRPTPFEMDCYAIEGYCPHCSSAQEGDSAGGLNVRWVKKDTQPYLFEPAHPAPAQGHWDFGQAKSSGSGYAMTAANHRFFKTPDPADLRRIEQAEALWQQVKGQLTWPKDHAIPYGYETRVGHDLWVHGYHDWSVTFHARQLMCLAQIATQVQDMSKWFSATGGAETVRIQESILCAFSNTLMCVSQLANYMWQGSKIERVFAGHHFRPVPRWCEGAVWGGEIGRGTFQNCVDNLVDGKSFCLVPFDNAKLAAISVTNNPFLEVPLSGKSCFEIPRFFRTAGELRSFESALQQVLVPGNHQSMEGTIPFERPAVLGESEWCFPWDGLGHAQIMRINSRTDFMVLKQQEGASVSLIAGDARDLRSIPDGAVDLVITDPPFGDNVNYGELSDFFYVWLCPILKGRYHDARGNDLFDHWEDEIMPKIRAEKDGIGFTEDPTLPPGFVRRRRLLQTPKQAEIIESRASQQTKTARDYNDSLRAAFAEAHRKQKPDGIMAFTFHHNDVRAWWAVVAALLECVPPDKQGFHLEAVYPIVGEAETTTHHHEKQNATFDIIHVCRKRTAQPTQIKWAMFRRKVREAVRRKREELLSIPAYNPQEGGYVSRNDLRMILLGVGFQLYSEHYGQVEFPRGFLRQAQAAPRGRRGKRTVAEAAAQLLFEESRQDLRRASDPVDDPSARNLCELTYAIDEILDEIEHEQANPLPPELESLAGEVDRNSRYYFKYLLPEHGRTIKYDDLKQLEYRTGVAVKDLTDADVLTTRHRKREYEIKRPSERYRRLRERFLDERPPLGILDRVHFLIGAIDDAAWAERNKVDPVRIDEFLVEGKPMDEAWADQKDQLVAAIRMIAAHTADEETKVACGRALKWLAPAVDLFTPATAKASAGEGNG